MRSTAPPVTLVTTDEFLVVNGVALSPFGGVNHHLAHLFYHLHRLARPLVRAVESRGKGSSEGRGAGDARWARVAERLWAALAPAPATQ